MIILKGKEGHVENIEYKTSPLVIRAIGSVSKHFLRTLGDYIPKAWSKEDGCISCLDEMISLQEKKVFLLSNILNFTFTPRFFLIKNNRQPGDYPVVVVGIFIEKATPFMDEFWQKFVDLGYPKDKIHLFIHNKVIEVYVNN